MAKKTAKKKAPAKKAPAKKAAKKATTKKAAKKTPAKKAATKKAAKKTTKKAADDGEKPVKKKKAAKRKRAAKVVRLKAYWGVFNQSLKRIELFEYNERKQADKKAAELSKKSPHFVQPVKEVIEE